MNAYGDDEGREIVVPDGRMEEAIVKQAMLSLARNDQEKIRIAGFNHEGDGVYASQSNEPGRRALCWRTDAPYDRFELIRFED